MNGTEDSCEVPFVLQRSQGTTVVARTRTSEEPEVNRLDQLHEPTLVAHQRASESVCMNDSESSYGASRVDCAGHFCVAPFDVPLKDTEHCFGVARAALAC